MGMERKKHRRRHLTEETSYICDACGEEIEIPVDLSAGESQEYVEDCPVCCRPNLIHVEIDESGDVRSVGRSGVGEQWQSSFRNQP